MRRNATIGLNLMDYVYPGFTHTLKYSAQGCSDGHTIVLTSYPIPYYHFYPNLS